MAGTDPLAWLNRAALAAEKPARRQTGKVDATDGSHPLAWTNRAACAGVDPAVFYPEHSGTDHGSHPISADLLGDAAAYCDRCPVRGDCLDFALHREKVGIWAGTDPFTRRRLRRGMGLTEPDDVDPDEATGRTPPYPSSTPEADPPPLSQQQPA